MTELPDEQIADASKLTADGIVELFHIILQDGSHLYLKADDTVTWQGHTWEGIGIKMGGISNSSDAGEVSRPQLVVANPAGAFSSFVVTKKLDRAEVMRLRVLRTHILANQNIFSQQSWKVMRVLSLNRQTIAVELRGQMDGPNFMTPARMYMPPEFPTVTL
jgi:phage-related protein